VYPTADGSDVLVAANGDALFRRLAEAMGRPELADDERYATHASRGANQDELDAVIAEWTSGLKAADLTALLDEVAVPNGLIYTAADISTDAHYAARGTIERLPDSALGVDVPMATVLPRLSASPGVIRSTGPELGEHTHWALTEVAGYDVDDVDALIEAGVVQVGTANKGE
jgi:crotonobetainyl-CoA:carnitine CoA-transferase CaiB-like acyl-CoA transferase